MALIQCTECGHMVSDRAETCPNCGCPVERPQVCEECGSTIPAGAQFCNKCGCPVRHPYTANYKEYYYEKVPKKSKGWIWALVTLLACALAGGGYYFYNKTNGVADEKTNEISIDSLLIDGQYTFKGNWDSSSHSAQPCKLEFEKNGKDLKKCAYTNLKYDSRIPLNGTIRGEGLHFWGEINGKQLVIDLRVSNDGNSLIGEGVDYAHSGDKAELDLAKVEFAKLNAIEQEHPNEEKESITDNGSNNISENPNKENYSEYIGKFRINGPDEIRQIITLREDRSVLLEVHYDFSNSDYKYFGVWRPYRSHYGDMICIDFTSDASLHIGRGWNPKQTIYYIFDMKIAMNYHDIPAHDEDAYSTITRM